MAKWLSDFLHDIRFAFRSLARAQTFSAIALFSLALGIGANTALLTAIHSATFRGVPGVSNADRVIELSSCRIVFDGPPQGGRAKLADLHW